MGILDKFSADDVSAALSHRFQISTVIRKGGQAVVFRAKRIKSPDGAHIPSEDVALKIHVNTSELLRVDREIEALGGFDHPCLAKFVEHGDINLAGDKTKYVAWRFIDGEALDEKIKRGPISPHLVVCVGRDIARAIDHIWQKKIVHRDINPKNVMVLQHERAAVLIDLGIARFLERSALTAAGMTWGTRGYFSPEQWLGDNLTCHSDVFSLAVTLQEALCGHHPTGFDQEELVRSPRRTSAISPLTPASIAELLDKCLALRPAFRPLPNFLATEFAEIAAQLN